MKINPLRNIADSPTPSLRGDKKDEIKVFLNSIPLYMELNTPDSHSTLRQLAENWQDVDDLKPLCEKILQYLITLRESRASDLKAHAISILNSMNSSN